MGEVSVSQNEIKKLLKRLGLTTLDDFYYNVKMHIRNLDLRVYHLSCYVKQLTKETEELKSQIKILYEELLNSNKGE